MPEIEDFLPLFGEETEATVLDRVLTWLNDGVAIGDPNWIDPREGGMARTLLIPCVREIATLYDRVSMELPAAASPLFAWGEYLDQWALALGTERLAATYADGFVRFSAAPGTVFESGVEVGTDTGQSYLTTEDGTVGVGSTVDVLAVASEPGVAGNVSAGAVNTILGGGPSVTAMVTNPGAMSGGTDEETDEQLRDRVLAIYSAVPGGGTVADYVQWTRSVPGVGGVAVTPESPIPGGVTILATTPEGEPVSLATQTAIRDYLDPVAVKQTASSVGTTYIQMSTTSGFRPSGIAHLGEVGHERLHTYTSITGTRLNGVSPAPTLTTGEHVWQTGRAGGRAPVGHHVVVGTGVGLAIAIETTIELEPGYALASSTGALDLRAVIVASVQEYIDSLVPGEEIVLRRIEAVIMSVIGVHDISGTKINGVAGNLTPDTDEVPMLSVLFINGADLMPS